MRVLFSQTATHNTYHRVKNACTPCAIPPACRPPRFPLSVLHTSKVQKKMIEKYHIDIINHFFKLITKIYISLIAM